MPNTNAGLWPQVAANSADVETADPWGLGAMIEAQARLWNHLLDANRSFWELYAPWLSSGPSLWKAPLAPVSQDHVPASEPEQGVDGVPDALESQARTWNHLLDANRNFWTAFAWQVPASPWVNGAAASAPAGDDEPAPPARKQRSTARKSGTKRPRA